MDNYESKYEFSSQSENFHKSYKYCFYSTLALFYTLISILSIQIHKENAYFTAVISLVSL